MPILILVGTTYHCSHNARMGRNKKILIRSDTASKAKVNEEFRYEILDTKLSGYFIRVLTTGFKSYNIRGRLKGKQITVSIGDCQIISEQEARKKAQEFKQLMKEGVDPRTTYLHEEHDELTLLDLLEDYRDTRGPKLKTSTYRRYKYQLEFYCPKLSAKPAQDLTAKEIKDWYRSMRDRPTSGERTFVTMKTLLTFAYKTKLLPELVTEELSYIGRYSKSNEPKRFIAKQHIDAWCEAFFSLSPVIEPMQEDLSSYQQYNNNRISMTARDYILFLMVTGKLSHWYQYIDVEEPDFVEPERWSRFASTSLEETIPHLQFSIEIQSNNLTAFPKIFLCRIGFLSYALRGS